MTSEKGCRKDKNQNIQVFVRLRPLNQRERDLKSLGVVEVHHNREVVVRISQQNSLTKKFTFDRAFCPNANQVEVYQEVVSPLIEEVLAGYNCTVFAYGQTGTGKTHTMVGENTGDETTWQKDPLAGIIPRALSQLFDELRISNTEYTVRVSYLELYNEELFDLLSTSEDNSKLRIYEDVTRKGSNIVNGLEEITVYNKKEVFKIMAQGQERKKVASTLMNAQSSRSHTVFTIVVHMKENSPEGEELVKIGKLNLVDLAGSENISKAGSDNPAKRERARECVNINQSLLTLGRVITALVERHPHVPYRESKLTRILQESLGGRTKTSIIATISPGHKDLEETMSTLEYAYRAKNIQNKPEINQKMTKKAILKEYVEEIDRLKRDLQAARDKNGVYLASDTFTEMTLKQEEQKKEIQELLLRKRAMEEERDRMMGVFSELHNKLETRESELNVTKNKLNNTKVELTNTNNMLRTTQLHYEEQRHLVNKHRETESSLSTQAKDLLVVADVATTHVACLHDTVDRRRSLESNNLQVTKTYREQSSEHREHITSGAGNFTGALIDALTSMHNALDTYTANSTQSQEENKQKLEVLVNNIVDTMNEITSATSASQHNLTQNVESHRGQLQSAVSVHQYAVQSAVRALVLTMGEVVRSAEGIDVRGNVAKFVEQWLSGAAARVTSLQRAHGAWQARAAAGAGARAAALARQRDLRRALITRRGEHIHACIAEIEQEKVQIERRLSKQLEDIDTERKETEMRLNHWMEEERRLLEERLAKHVAAETMALEKRLEKKIQEVEEEKKLLEDRIARHIESQRTQLEANREDMESADKDLEEWECEREEDQRSIKKYDKEFDEGVSAISTDMEVFSRNVVEVVDHINNDLLRALRQANEQIEQEVDKVISTDNQTCKQLTDDVDAVLNDIVSGTKRTMDTVLDKIETNNTSIIQELNHLSSTTDTLICTSRSHLAAQSTSIEALRTNVCEFNENIREAVDRHAALEGRYLAQEYRVYSPTGKTPSRTEYRYPRVLASTSPHDRILARFRAMRQNSEDECIVLESDTEIRIQSDSESSVSEDSAVFAAPSPPSSTTAARPDTPAPAPAAAHAAHIVKSTSETDIYVMKRQQEVRGKENPDRSISYKKQSKLRAPASLKKPLVERNGTQ